MKRILSTFSQKWPEYLLEMVVITAGILGAYALNNWNERRTNQIELQNILLNLKTEYETNIRTIEGDIAFNKESQNATDVFIQIIRDNEVFPHSRYTDSVLLKALTFTSFDPQTGGTDAILNGGKLNLIDDDELKSKLTGWSGVLKNSNEDYEIRIAHTFRELQPFLYKYFRISNNDLFIDWTHWSKEYESNKLSETPLEPSTDFNRLELEGLMYVHKWNNNFVIINESEMLAYFRETLRLIDMNLKKPR